MRAIALIVLTMALLWRPCQAVVKVAAGQVESSTAATPAQTVALNVDTILGLMSLAEFQNVSFIAFPEFALMGTFTFGDCSATVTVAAYSEIIGNPGDVINCSESSPIARIGCSTAAKSLVVSYNTVENDAGTFYNTQAIVHNGVLLARYRKYNVFYKSCFASPQLELVTFSVTNVTFGVFTCYDILFDHPKMDLVKQGVKYFSYSSAIPIIGADAVSLFAAENAVNVVSSNNAAGQSTIVDHGLTIARAPASGNAIVVATLA
jgi:predicted amidohydrolase